MKKLFLVVAISLVSISIGCGGQTRSPRLPDDNPPPHSTPTPAPTPVPTITITANQVFDSTMVGQTWFFEGTCGGNVLDPLGNLITTYPEQPFHTTVAVEHGTAFTYTKDVDCGYWALGVKDAALYDFTLEQDADGGWYNTSGHEVMPFGCPWCTGPVDNVYTILLPTDPTVHRGYQIIPPKGDNQHTISLRTSYDSSHGTVHWRTDAYVESVNTPIFTGNALISEQWEGGNGVDWNTACAHEKWYFAPDLGMVKVIAYAVPGCSGLQTTTTMVRTK